MASQDNPLKMSGSQNSIFWNDIPMDILLELQSGLEQVTSYTPATHEQTNEFWSDYQELVPAPNWSPTRSQDDGTRLRESNKEVPLGGSFGIDPSTLFDATPVKQEPVSKKLSAVLKSPTVKREPGTKDPKGEEEEGDYVPPPLEPHSGEAANLLAEIMKQQIHQEKHLLDLTSLQKKVTLSNRDDFTQLQQQLFKLHQQITQELKELDSVFKKHVLNPTELWTLHNLIQLLHLQQQRTELYKVELQHVVNEDSKCAVALAIASQPGALIVFKGRAVEAVFTVKLVTGAKVILGKASEVCASLADEDAWKNTKPLANERVDLEDDKTATFKQLKINVSTRMTAIHMKFSCTVQEKGSKEELTVKSTLTNPIIVITNESQWAEAAGKLIQLDAFAGQPTISWAQYVNTLHGHLFRATGQDPQKPSRVFNAPELQYIQERFFENKAKITRDEAGKCWTWLGEVLTTIRFKRHIKTLWFDGLIYGLISKRECNRLLKNQAAGAFLIRFSDSSPGSFAVAYATDDTSNRIKHYLVKPDDIGSTKSLPDFLREKKLLATLLCLDTSAGTVRKLGKEKAFDEFYSTKTKKGKASNPDRSGYVQNLEMETS